MRIKLFVCLLALLPLVNCQSVKVLSDLPPKEQIVEKQRPIVLRTRLVIEKIKFGERSLEAISLEDAMKHLKRTSEIYKDLNIAFYIDRVDYVASECFPTLENCYIDGERFPNHISIYFVFIKPSLPMLPGGLVMGEATPPSFLPKQGITIVSILMDQNTLPHEFGHYFGLLHTFQRGGDGVDDTLDTAGNNVAKLADKNIMSYYDGDDAYVTPGQLNRMKSHILTDRANHFMSDVQ